MQRKASNKFKIENDINFFLSDKSKRFALMDNENVIMKKKNR